MNKKLTFMLLIVVLAAMSLVFFTQMQQTDKGTIVTDSRPAVDRDGRMVPKDSQKPGNGLPSIDPPVGVSIGADGAPKPVALTTGKELDQTKPGATATAPPTGPQAAPAEKPAEAAKPPKEKESGAPSLTPWEVPPAKGAEKQKTTTADAGAKSPQKAPAGTEQTKPAAKSASEGKKQEAKPKSEAKPARPKAESTPAEPGVRRLTGIKLTPKGQNMHLRIESDGGFSCKTFVLTGPDRLVIDLPGKWKGVKAPSVPSNQLVKNARVGDQPTGPRVVLDLARPIKGHQVQRLNNAIEVVLQ